MASSSPPAKNIYEENGDLTPLQKHVAFFDRNHDGLIYPWETFRGFRAVGCGIPLSIAGATLINIGFSQKTRPGKFPSLLFPIDIKYIHTCKHGSDSDTYDAQGRFDPVKFEDIFRKHAHTNSDALTSDELMEMLKANRDPKDYKNWLVSWSEWKLLYSLGKDKNEACSMRLRMKDHLQLKRKSN
nr:probable peroxygenase 4 isoform X2 [Ziziphus jujuba var. spinosa]